MIYHSEYSDIGARNYEDYLDFQRVCGNVLIGIRVFFKWRYSYIINYFLSLDIIDDKTFLRKIIDKAIRKNRSHSFIMKTITSDFLNQILDYSNF